jgi:hypothetical protein
MCVKIVTLLANKSKFNIGPRAFGWKGGIIDF